MVNRGPQIIEDGSVGFVEAEIYPHRPIRREAILGRDCKSLDARRDPQTNAKGVVV